ncbi:hypothetical protein AUP68_04130 [Ilyonectria robusta]
MLASAITANTKADKPRPYVCGTCKRSFARLYNLKRHERSHTNKKPFKCPECARCFTRGDMLLRHKQMLHQTLPLSLYPQNCHESASSVVPDQSRARKNSVAGPNPAISNILATSTGLLVNAIIHVDGSMMQMITAANTPIARDIPLTHTHSRYPSLDGLPIHSLDYDFSGISAAVGQRGMQHGLVKPTTRTLGLEPNTDLQTAPSMAFNAEFDFEGRLFEQNSTINLNVLHYNNSLQSMALEQASPFAPSWNEMPLSQTLDNSFERLTGFEHQTAFLANEDVVDRSSPSAITAGISLMLMKQSSKPPCRTLIPQFRNAFFTMSAFVMSRWIASATICVIIIHLSLTGHLKSGPSSLSLRSTYLSVASSSHCLNGLLTAVSRGYTRLVQPPGMSASVMFWSLSFLLISSVLWNVAASMNKSVSSSSSVVKGSSTASLFTMLLTRVTTPPPSPVEEMTGPNGLSANWILCQRTIGQVGCTLLAARNQLTLSRPTSRTDSMSTNCLRHHQTTRSGCAVLSCTDALRSSSYSRRVPASQSQTSVPSAPSSSSSQGQTIVLPDHVAYVLIRCGHHSRSEIPGLPSCRRRYHPLWSAARHIARVARDKGFSYPIPPNGHRAHPAYYAYPRSSQLPLQVPIGEMLAAGIACCSCICPY